MKTVHLFLLLLIAATGYSAERSRPPLLFSYQPDQSGKSILVPSPQASLEESKTAFKPDPRPELREYRKSEFEKVSENTWIDTMPIVVWAASFKDGLFVARVGNGHMSFLSSKRNVFGFQHPW